MFIYEKHRRYKKNSRTKSKRRPSEAKNGWIRNEISKTERPNTKTIEEQKNAEFD